MTGRLAGKVALVTGAGAGIGLAIVRRFVEEGAQVVAADIDPAKLARFAGPDVQPCLCDVADAAAGRAAVTLALETYGALHVLVNGAATLTPDGTVVELDEADWREALEVNLTGCFLMAKAAVPAILKSGGGSIVNIASQMGSVGSRNRAAYNASKAGVINLTRVMALDHAGQGIRVNALSPGAVLTDRLLKRLGSAQAAEAALVPLHPIGRLGRPEEIAAAALFLASDDASFMTGADLVVDGGYTAQ